MKKSFLLITLLLFLFALNSDAAVYEVKENTAIDTIAKVPWATLQPGDTVLINWRATAYKEKWVICRQGTAAAPIVVRGVANPTTGELPIIDGNGAITPLNLNFASETRGVIKIGSANIPADTMPKYITIENLDIRSAHPSYQFKDDGGATQTYSDAASSIYVEKGENIVIRNNIIHDSANGFFVASSDDTVSRNITVEGNYIYGNGIVGSGFQHNNYTAAIGITFQYNRFGPLRAGANGNNLKDRSAGLIVRYNWIESGNRQLDLVDAEDSVQIRNDASYHRTFVYGNILIEPDGAGNSQILHYGGDSGSEDNYRKGILHFYHNSVVSTRSGNTTLMRLSTNDETCDARNNIFYNTAAGANLAMLAETGNIVLRSNWVKNGWRNSHEGSGFGGTVTVVKPFVVGTSPGFVDEASQNFKLATNSSALDVGADLSSETLPANNVTLQYVKHQRSEARPVSVPPDLGAYEFNTGGGALTLIISDPPIAIRGRFYHYQLQATGGSGNYTWSVPQGNLPPGLFLNPTTGEISGKLVRKGNYTFQIIVQDAQGSTQGAIITLNVKLYAGVN